VRRPSAQTLRRDAPESSLAMLLVVLLVLGPLVAGSTAWFNDLLLVAIYVPAVVGLNILRCEAGQYNFGQGAVFGLSAYATALTLIDMKATYFVAAVIGIAVALLGGFLLALPSLRVQGFYLGFVTLTAAIVFPDLLYGFDSFTHATSGLITPLPAIGSGIDRAFTPLVWLVLAAGIGSILLHYGVRKTSFGRSMRLVATSESASRSLGVRPSTVRISAFVIAAGLAGVSGALYVPYLSYVSPGAFPIDTSILFYFAVVVGGEGTIIGPLLGVLLLQAVPNNLLSGLLQYALIVYGVIAFGVMFLLPEGIVPGVIEFTRLVFRRGRKPRRNAPDITAALPRIGAQVSGAQARPDEPEREPVLEVRGVSRSFGGVRALQGVDLTVRPGTIHALVGPNGCGKSTLLNVVSGLIQPDSGSVVVNDGTLSRPSALATSAIGRTFQVPQLVGDLSPWDNVRFRLRERAPAGTVDAALAASRAQLDQGRADALSHAQRRMLEVLRALAGDTSLLLLDEPAAGLSARERTVFAGLLRTLVGSLGVTVLLVEHDLALVWEVADEITVMRAGQVVVSGPPDEIRRGRELDVLMGFADADG
jgi:branched-chain amino acid transport system permease protein